MNTFRHRKGLSELRRAVQSHKYDMTENGIYVPAMRQEFLAYGRIDAGVFRGGDRSRMFDRDIAHNIVPIEARNKALNQLVKNAAAIANWYIGLFEGNYTPVDTVTGATFALAATEFEDYDEATRVLWTPEATAAAGAIESDARSEFTMSTGVSGKVLYGAALLQNSTKGNSTVGQLALSVARFGTSKTVSEGDVLSLSYGLELGVPA